MKNFQNALLPLGFILSLCIFACSVSVSGVNTGVNQKSVNNAISKDAVLDVSPEVMLQRLGRGINIGNTLDAPTEGAWAAPVQEYYFDDIKIAGFDSVRIPITWGRHLDVNNPYQVDPVFMNRVETVVDWALARNLAVVMNCHHEDWIRTNYPASMIPRFESLWDQIATRFAGKSENLVFEILNEPHGAFTKDNANDVNTRILKVIRRTNPTRNVIFTGFGYANYYPLINNVIIPNDNHVIATFHYYIPFSFCADMIGTWGSAEDIKSMSDKFQSVKDWSVAKKVPVYLGEFGVRKQADGVSRLAWYRNICQFSRKHGFAYTVWDDSGGYAIYDRKARTWETPVLKEIIGTAVSSSSSSSSISSSSSAAGPAGYTYCANEGQAYTFNQTVDVAYGANGKFNYKSGVTGTITFNNATFGDPIPGVVKKGYYKAAAVSSKSSSSSSSSSASLSTSSAPSSSSSKSASSSSKSSVSSSIGTVTEVTIPFTKEGKGEFWYKTSQTPNYMNSWNLDVLEVNGVSLLNVWVSGANLPAKLNGYYNIHYKGSYDWSHFEAK